MVLRASHNPLNFGDFERALGFSIGFDSMFDRLLGPSTQHVTNNQGFPPYNIRKEGEFSYVIDMALAGFSKDDIEVEVADGLLTVRSVKENEENEESIYRGISYRKFNRKFTLADEIVVKDASLENGMLVISLERIVPEEKKPRKIKIK